MFNSRRERYTLVSMVMLASLLTLAFSNVLWTGAAGETTVTEENLFIADGSGNLNMTQNEILDVILHASNSAPAAPDEGQIYYDLDDHAYYVYNGTAWSSIGGAGEQGEPGPPGTLEGEQPYSYLVFTNVTATYMLNGTTGEVVWGSVDDGAVLQSAIGNLSAVDGGGIFIKPPFYTDDIITVDKSMVTIEAPNADEAEKGVWIRRLKLDSSSNTIRNCRFAGLGVNEIHIFADDDYAVYNIDFERCVVRKTTTYPTGIVYEGEGGLAQGSWSVRWKDCHFQFQSPVTGAMFTYKACAGVTEHYVVNSYFQMSNSDQVLFHLDNDARVAGFFLLNPRITMVATSKTGIKFVEYEAYAGASVIMGFQPFVWRGGRVEMHSDYTIFDIPLGTPSHYFSAIVEGVEFGTSSSAVCTLFNVPNYNWSPDAGKVSIIGNHFPFSSPTLGTWLVGNRHKVIIKDNVGLNPIGLVATPFETAAATRTVISPFGDEVAPTASTNYLIQCTGIFLTSTDSGNTDCNITITDANDNALIIDASTLTLQYIPRGYTINWGAFTGTAPTVTVYFE